MHSSIKAGPCFRTLTLLCTLVFSAAAAPSSGSDTDLPSLAKRAEHGKVPSLYQGYSNYAPGYVEPVGNYNEHSPYADQGYGQHHNIPAHYADGTKYMESLNYNDDFYGIADKDWQEEPQKVTKKKSTRKSSSVNPSRKLLQEPGQQAYPQQNFPGQGTNTPQQVPYQSATPEPQIPDQVPNQHVNPGQQMPNNQGIIYPPGTPDWIVYGGQTPPAMGHMDRVTPVKVDGPNKLIPGLLGAGIGVGCLTIGGLCYCQHKNKKNKGKQGQGHEPTPDCPTGSCGRILPQKVARSDNSFSKEGHVPSQGGVMMPAPPKRPMPPSGGRGGRSGPAGPHYRKRELSAGERKDLFNDDIYKNLLIESTS